MPEKAILTLESFLSRPGIGAQAVSVRAIRGITDEYPMALPGPFLNFTMNNTKTNELLPRLQADGLGKAESPANSHRRLGPKAAANNSVAGLPGQARPAVRNSSSGYLARYRHWGINE
jgi:hypothetical protein